MLEARKPASFLENDVFDVGRIIRLFGKNFKVIALVTVIGLFAGLFDTLVSRGEYTSRADVLLSGTRFQVKFDERLPSNELIRDLQAAAVTARQSEYDTIAKSFDVRKAVALRLSDLLTKEEIDVQAIPGSLSTRISGALVGLEVTASSPELAQRVANAYATEVAERLNAVYGQTDQDVENIRQETRRFSDMRQHSSVALQQFLAQSPVPTIVFQIQQREHLKIVVLDQTKADLRVAVGGSGLALRLLDSVEADASALRSQVARGSGSSASLVSAAFSVVNLYGRFVAVGDQTLARSLASESLVKELNSQRQTSTNAENSPNISLQLENGAQDRTLAGQHLQATVNIPGEAVLSRSSRELLLADLDQLIQLIQNRKDEIARDRHGFYAQITGPADRPIARNGVGLSADDELLISTLNQEIAQLQARLEEATRKQRVLEAEVEELTKSEASLNKKLQESTIATGAGGGKATVVASAGPGRQNSTALARRLGTAVAAGFILGVLLAIALQARVVRRARPAPQPGV